MNNIEKIFAFFRYLLYLDYRVIKQHNIFDADYFLKLSNTGKESDSDLIWLYLKVSKEQCAAQIKGPSQWQQLADPHPLFDTAFYLKRYFPEGIDRNPFAHYLQYGWKEHKNPGPFLEQEVYKKRSQWDGKQCNPLNHYAKHGVKQNISPGYTFDINWYLDRTPILKKAPTHIIRHYKLFGSKEGKSPVPVFNPRYYLSQLEDSGTAKRDPLSHFITEQHNARPEKWFNPSYYLEGLPSSTTPAEALTHYLQIGVRQKLFTDPRIAELKDGPLISIVVPVYKPEIHFLNNCIRSVIYQHYPNWELCLVDDGSDSEVVKSTLSGWAASDERIKIRLLDKNSGISAATNAGVDLTTGQYVGFLDNDDELTHDCLYHFVKAIKSTKADFLYSDEELIGEDGRTFSIFRKPSLNVELLLSHNYVTHFVVVAKSLLSLVGGFDPRCDGAQDYDLVLKLASKARKCKHVPEVLYRWRASKKSTSVNHSQKSFAHDAGKKALSMHLKEQGYDVSVEDAEINFYYKIRYHNLVIPQVSLFVFLGDAADYNLSTAETMRQRSGAENYHSEYIVKQNGQSFGVASLTDDQLISSGPHPKSLTKAEIMHKLISGTDSELLVFVEPGVTDWSESWLVELITPLLLNRGVGQVAGRFIYKNEQEHSYTIPDLNERSPRYLTGFLANCSTHMNGLHCPQLVSYCDWGVVALSRALYDELGGFDCLNFPHHLAMLDLSMRAGEMNKKIMFTPHAVLTSDRKTEIETPVGESLRCEMSRFFEIHRDRLGLFDPFYNPGILDDNNLDREQFLNWISGRTLEESLDEKENLHY